MKKALTLAIPERPAPSLWWAVLAGELSLGLVLFGGHLVPDVAVRALRLFLRF
jgi:hypothetical protein